MSILLYGVSVFGHGYRIWMCKYVGIRDSAHNIDTYPCYLRVKLTKLNFKIAIICIPT